MPGSELLKAPGVAVDVVSDHLKGPVFQSSVGWRKRVLAAARMGDRVIAELMTIFMGLSPPVDVLLKHASMTRVDVKRT